MRGGHRGDKARCLHGLRHTVSVRGRILECYGHERAQHDKMIAFSEFGIQRFRIGGHVAPIAQLSPGVAGLDKFVQHAVKRNLLARVLVLDRAPGTRRVANQ